MLMLEHLDTLSANAANAIANIKFDKVVVWDGGNGTTANFLQSLAGALPPTMKIMKDIGGVDMPEYFGKLQADAPAAAPAASGAAPHAPPSTAAPRPPA
jgi:flotillin